MSGLIGLLGCTGVVPAGSGDSSVVEDTGVRGTWAQVSAASVSSCGRAHDGAVACWGSDSFGESSVPEGLRASDISAGLRTSCAVDLDGSLVCWGDTQMGEPPTGDFVQVRVAPLRACAVTNEGSLSCWGEGADEAPSDGDWVAVDVGSGFGCALSVDGAITCWGLESPEGGFVALDAGQGHVCGLGDGGAIRCWGEDADARLDAPDAVFDSVTAGIYHGCGLLSDADAALCWGADGAVNFGQVPAAGGSYRSVAAGGWHNCAVTTVGELECWGADNAGQSTPP